MQAVVYLNEQNKVISSLVGITPEKITSRITKVVIGNPVSEQFGAQSKPQPTG